MKGSNIACAVPSLKHMEGLVPLHTPHERVVPAWHILALRTNLMKLSLRISQFRASAGIDAEDAM